MAIRKKTRRKQVIRNMTLNSIADPDPNLLVGSDQIVWTGSEHKVIQHLRNIS